MKKKKEGDDLNPRPDGAKRKRGGGRPTCSALWKMSKHEEKGRGRCPVAQKRRALCGEWKKKKKTGNPVKKRGGSTRRTAGKKKRKLPSQ